MPVLICAMLAGARPAFAEDPPAEITTDSVAYCMQLHERVENMRLTAAVPPPAAAVALSAEGEHMCAMGLSRGGVLRLRRALAIMKHADKDR